ncbi:MAG: hypothetical protein KBI19_06745 [Candidatus Cloacimonas sp.]|nr:hypothetical protein [Candidatus Cloacimonas sp.]
MAGKLLRSVCPACGAPVARIDRRHGFVCPYCGTEFYPEDGAEISDYSPSPIKEIPYKSETTDFPSNKKSTNKVWIYLIMIGFLIFFISAPSWFFSSPKPTNPVFPEVVEKPSMLLNLPSAKSAEESVAYKEFELRFDPNIHIDTGLLYFDFTLQNWGDKVVVLRYRANNFIVYDDLGNTYPLYLSNCDVDLPYIDRQIEMEPNEIIEFESSRSWCSSGEDIPAFIGVIPMNAQQIYFHFKEFGVFTDLTFIFDL